MTVAPLKNNDNGFDLLTKAKNYEEKKPKDELKNEDLDLLDETLKIKEKTIKKSKPKYIKNIWTKIKEKITIPELISIDGNRGLCLVNPNPENPALQYNEYDDIAYCYRCGKAMDVIQIYAILNNLERSDAIKELVKQYKIEFGKYDEKYIKTEEEIHELFEDFTTKCYENLVDSEYYEFVKNKRDFTDETMKMFKIGIFDDSVKKYINKTYPRELLYNAGFRNKRKWIFGKRIVYPYFDRNGNSRYYIYRLIEAEPDSYPNAKYRKQRKTEYIKEIPFGLNSIHLYKKKPLIITEGMTDSISVIQAGYPVLSPITNKIKNTDIERMIKHCKNYDKVFVIFDNEEFKKNEEGEIDNQGLKGAIKTLRVLIPNNINCFIGIIPNPEKLEKVDLNDYLRPKKDAIRKLDVIIKSSMKGIDFLIGNLNSEFTTDDVKEIIKLIPKDDVVERKNILNKIKGKTKLTKEELKAIEKQIKDDNFLKEKRKQERTQEQGSLENGEYEQPERILANLVLDNFPFLHTLRNTEEFCLNTDGVYIRGKITETIIREFLAETTKGFMYITPEREIKEYVETQAKRSMIYEFIKAKSFIDYSKFDYFENKFSVLNGVLEFNEENFEWKFTNHKDLKEPLKTFVQFPIHYEPNACCPKIEQLLIDIFDEERLELIYDELAYLLMPTIKYGKSFFHYGETHTAKTTHSNLINQFIGKESHGKKQIREIPLHRLTERFQMPNLIGAVLNKCDDQPDNAITNITVFRKICTNKSLEEEVKNVQERVQWNNRTKLISLSNKLTPNKNFIDADYRRIILIEHYNQFIGKDKEPKLRDKIYSQKELSGLLNKCLKAWIRIEKRKGFSPEWDNIDYVKSIFQMEQNPVAPFIEECCEISPLFSVDYDLFFKAINIYKTGKSLQPIAKGIITRRLKEIDENYRKVTVSTKKHINSSGYKYIGLTIKKSWLEKNSDKISKKKANLVNFLRDG